MSMGDKQYAENVAGSGGAGGSGEPADSFTEVATGLRDSDGNMIYKKSYSISSYSANMTIDDELVQAQYRIDHVRGYVENSSGSTRPIPHYFEGNYNMCPYIDDGGLKMFGGAGYGNAKVYLTVYYTHKPVPRATARKTTTK